MKFVDVTNDVAFRKIFGNEKKTKILISFLNAILKFEGSDRIVQVEIIDPNQLPRIRGEKASIIDIRAKDETGRKFVVEMQVASVDGFDKRVQYYACREYSMQIERGEQYPLLRPAFFIGILDFDFFDSKSYLSHHIIVNGETLEHKLKDIQFTFIELRKFKLEMDELETLTEKWVFFIKNAENLEVIPEHVNDDGLMEAYKEADRYSWNKNEWIAYDNASIAEQDERGKIIAAEKKAKIEVIEKALNENLSIDLIARIVGLSIGETTQIIAEINKKKSD
ncbi:MAG: Rpn family recombination-promoting nuclease/putative transposase [Bacteroidota bacterium]